MAIVVGTQILDESSIVRERDKNNYYPTPLPFVKWMLSEVLKNELYPRPMHLLNYLDAGCGTGNFGIGLNDLRCENVDGIELYYDRYKNDIPSSVYKTIYVQDLVDPIQKKYDVVLGNPPYTKKTKKHSGTTDMVVNMYKTGLRENGFMFLLLPASFVHGKERFEKLFTSEMMPYKVIHLVNRVNFLSENGKGGSYPGGEYSIYCWKKRSFHQQYSYIGEMKTWADIT